MSYHRDKDRLTRGPGAIASIDNRRRYANRQQRLRISEDRDAFLSGLTFGERGGVVGGMGAINAAGIAGGLTGGPRRPVITEGGGTIEGGGFSPIKQYGILTPQQPIILQPGTGPTGILPPKPLYVSGPLTPGTFTKSPDVVGGKPPVGVRFPRPRPTVAPGTAGGLLTGNVSSGGGGGGGGGSSAPPPAVTSPIVPIYDPEPLPEIEDAQPTSSSGIPKWVWLLGAGAVAYYLYKKNQGGAP